MSDNNVNPFKPTPAQVIPVGMHLWNLAETLYKAQSPSGTVDISSDPGKPLKLDAPLRTNPSGPFAVSVGGVDASYNETLIVGGTGSVKRTETTPGIIWYNGLATLLDEPDTVSVSSLWPLPPESAEPAIDPIITSIMVKGGFVHTKSASIYVEDTVWETVGATTLYIYVQYACTSAGVESASIVTTDTAFPYWVSAEAGNTAINILIGQVEPEGFISGSFPGDKHILNYGGRTVSPDFANAPLPLKNTIYKEREMPNEGVARIFIAPELYNRASFIEKPMEKIQLFFVLGRGLAVDCSDLDKAPLITLNIDTSGAEGLSLEGGALHITDNVICDPVQVLGRDALGKIGWVATATCADTPGTCTPADEPDTTVVCADLVDPVEEYNEGTTGTYYDATTVIPAATNDPLTRLLVIRLDDLSYELLRADYALELCRNWRNSGSHYHPLAWITIEEYMYEDDTVTVPVAAYKIAGIKWIETGWIITDTTETHQSFQVIVKRERDTP